MTNQNTQGKMYEYELEEQNLEVITGGGACCGKPIAEPTDRVGVVIDLLGEARREVGVVTVARPPVARPQGSPPAGTSQTQK